MGLKNKKNKVILFYIKSLLNFILVKIKHIKNVIKQFIYEHIVAIYIICILLILLYVNIGIRNNRIKELETKVNELQLELNNK